MLANGEIAEIFFEIADRLDMDGENFFKSRAMRRGAQTIESLPEPLAEYRDRLQELPGIGDAIAKKIIEILDTGRLNYLEELRKEVPVDFPGLNRIQGLGPKKIKLLYEKIGVKNVEDLKAAATGGKLRDIKGMGEKTEKALLEAIDFSEKPKRFYLWEARQTADSIIAALGPYSDAIEACGSLRRWKETVGDIDLLAVSSNPEKLMNAFIRLEGIRTVLARGKTKSSIVLKDGPQIDLRIVPNICFGAALQYFTGSQSHNIELRKIAKAKGLKLSEYGLFKGDKRVAGSDEIGVYKALGLDYIPPELREDRGEISAALEHRLPKLIEASDIKGDLHMHSVWSDGRATLRGLAAACIKRGYEYMAIADHVGDLKIANAMSPEQLQEQWKEIRQLNSRLKPFRILRGAEVQIDKDGRIDFPEEMLAKLEIVVASIHTSFNGTEAEMTNRICKAMENKYVTFIAHPTGRMLNVRPAYPLNLSAVFQKAGETGKGLEINSHPARLDLNDVAVRDAKTHTKIVINTDSHSILQLDFMHYGVATARRAWCTAKDVLNACSLRELLEVITPRP